MAPSSPYDDKHGVEHDAAEHDCRVTDHQPGLHHLIRNLTYLLIRHTLPLSPGVIRTLASLARVIINLALFGWSSHTMIRNSAFLITADLPTSTEHSQLSDPSSRDQQEQKCSFAIVIISGLSYSIFNYVALSRSTSLYVWWQSLETLLVNKFKASWSAPMLRTSSDHCPLHPVCICVSLKMWSMMLFLWLDELLFKLRPSPWLDKILVMNSWADRI